MRQAVIAVLLGVLLFPPPPAQSQETTAGEKTTAGDESPEASAEEAALFPAQIEEVTVTARRREENVQKVPGAISVISSEDLETRQIGNARDVKKVVTNMTFEANPGSSNHARIFLRGVGTDEPLFTAEPPIAIYVDDVYIARMSGASFELDDLERVEVLRGPQGTLYGRNATGGAIKLYTSAPDSRNRLRLGLTAGELSESQVRLSGGTGFSDTTSVGLALLRRQRDGYSTDLVNDREVNDEDLQTGRLSFHWAPREEFNFTLRGDWSRERATAGFPSSVLSDPDRDLYTLESGLDDLNDLDQRGASLHFSRIGRGVHLESITAWRELDHLSLNDLDGTPLTIFHLFLDQEQQQLSQELRLSSADGKVEWLAGAFLFAEDNVQPSRNDIFAFILGPGPTNTISQDTRAYAVFGQVGTSVGNLQLTAGLRSSYEKKEFDVVSVLADGSDNFTFRDEEDWEKVDFRVELDYRFSDRTMGYALFGSGFRSGGFNGRGASPAALAPYDEEEILNAEIGFKGDLLDHRLRLNANYFFNQYDDLQQPVLDPNGVFRVVNAADVEIQGIELELRFLPIPRLQFDVHLGTLDAEYKELRDPLLNPDQLKLKQAPELTWRAAAQYTFLFGKKGYLTASADLGFTDDHFQNVANSPRIATEAYTLLNARLAYGPSSGVWELALVATNLSDEVYVAAGVDVPGLGISAVYPNKPRWIGGTLTWRF